MIGVEYSEFMLMFMLNLAFTQALCNHYLVMIGTREIVSHHAQSHAATYTTMTDLTKFSLFHILDLPFSYHTRSKGNMAGLRSGAFCLQLPLRGNQEQ